MPSRVEAVARTAGTTVMTAPSQADVLNLAHILLSGGDLPIKRDACDRQGCPVRSLTLEHIRAMRSSSTAAGHFPPAVAVVVLAALPPCFRLATLPRVRLSNEAICVGKP